MTRKTAKPFSPELRERAVRMVREREGRTQWGSVGAIAAEMGRSRETPRRRVGQERRNAGRRPGLATDERGRIKALKRAVRALRQANEILRRASACFARAALDRPFKR